MQTVVSEAELDELIAASIAAESPRTHQQANAAADAIMAGRPLSDVTPPTGPELAATLRHRIEDGTFPPDAMLPTLAGLAARYRVTMSIAQRATGLLQAEGLVERRPGSLGARFHVTGPASAAA